MSKDEVTKVLERALNEKAFREQLKTEFEKAVKGYKLSSEEKTALKNGDQDALRAMGVDERLTKWPTWR